MNCRRCGHQLAPEARFCPKCGTSVEKKTALVDNENKNTSDKLQEINNRSFLEKYRIYFVIGIIVAIVIIGLFMRYIKGNSNSNVDSSTLERVVGITGSSKSDSQDGEITDHVKNKDMDNETVEREMGENTENEVIENEKNSEIVDSENDSGEFLLPPSPEEMIMTHCAGIEAPASDFVFPYSSEQYLTEEDLKILEADEPDIWHTDIVDQEHSNSQMAINEILARYGYPFKSNASKKTGQEAYEKFSPLLWYQEAKSYCRYSSGDEAIENLNPIEKANVDLINEWQKQHGCYY